MSSIRKTKSSATAEDVIIGGRLRQARLRKGLTQPQVGDIIGVSFQQIQKYERGVNRISAGRLRQFARLYRRPYSYFLNDMVADMGRHAHYEALLRECRPLLDLYDRWPQPVRDSALALADEIIAACRAETSRLS